MSPESTLTQSTKRLGRKVIFALVLASSVITLIITAFQIYRDYDHELNLIEQRFAQIESVYVPSISHSLWKTDSQELMLQLEGISRLPYIQYLAVTENKQIVTKRGEIKSKNTLARIYPLNFKHRGELLFIGEFQVVVELDDIYKTLTDKVWVILISNAIKTFLVTLFALFIFRYLVTRHIVSLAEQVRAIDVADLKKDVRLQRTINVPGQEDELDVLVHAFDAMRHKVSESFDKITRREAYLRRYESILSSTKDMMSYVDNDYIYRAVNQAYSDFFGKNQQEIIGEHVEKLLGREQFNEFLKPNLDKVFNGKHIHFNTRLQDKNARWIDVEVNYYPYFDETGEIQGAVVNVRDISERVNADAERARNAQVYKTLALQGAINFNDFVLNCLRLLQDVYDAKFIMIGKLLPRTMQIQMMTALSSGEVQKNVVYELAGTPCERVFKENKEFVYDGVADKFPQDRFLQELNAESYFGLPLIDTRGFTVGLLVVIDDKPRTLQSWHKDILSAFAARISLEMERAEALAKLENYNADLEYRVKLRTTELENSIRDLETFSYSVSHDLRTPLRAINGYSRLLIEDFNEVMEEQSKSYLDNIIKASERMGILIDSLLRLSRIGRQPLEIQEVNLSELVKNSLGDYHDDLARNTMLRVQDNVYYAGDKNLLQVAIDNLISNAVKYTSKCTQPLIEFGTMQSGMDTVYFIRDNGVGFDERFADKLFEPFQRLHDENEYQGLGIGLATVLRILHRHGGRIWAESKDDNKGAIFYFTLGEMKKYEVA